MTDQPGMTEADADRAMERGDLTTAETLIFGLAREQAGRVDLWMKLAAIRRALGAPGAALEAVNAALTASPLDFLALLMRATLLGRLGDPSAGEAYGHALAQKPSGALAPPVAAAVERAEHYHRDWLGCRDDRLRGAIAAATVDATPAEQARLARFRTNALRVTHPYHSDPTHFYFPGLASREFHDADLFPWLRTVEAATSDILREFAAAAAAERAELVPYIQYEAHEPLRQWRALNHSRDWTAIHLWRNGRTIGANARHCPRTMALLRDLPQPRIAGCSPNAMFSLLAPHTNIPSHNGVANTRLVCHLPLIVPEGCWFRVGAETREWRVGEAFVFDDTIEHEAANPSDLPRVVFIFDLWQPDLTTAERCGITAMMEAEAGSILETL